MELDGAAGRMRRRDCRAACWLPPPAGCENVVVTPALKLWHTYRALEMVYGDAYNSQLNDRYAGKRDQFHERGEVGVRAADP